MSNPDRVAVRIVGNDKTGYKIQYTHRKFKYLPFLTIWFDHEPLVGRTRVQVVPTIEEAREYALDHYNWLVIYNRKEYEKKMAKKIKEVVWAHP